MEEIEIRLYSIFYDAINEINDALEGLLKLTENEVIKGKIRPLKRLRKMSTKDSKSKKRNENFKSRNE